MVLKVGPKKTRFDVHKRQLCELSPFFNAAFNGKFQEKAGTMNLVEDNLYAFEHFVRWIYERNVDIPLEGKNDETLKARMRDLIDVYILADKYDIPALKNSIMEILFDAVKIGSDKALQCLRLPKLRDMEHIFANTGRGSTLRKFVTACNTWFVSRQWYTEDTGSNWLHSNPEIATDLAIGFAFRLKGDISPFTAGKDASPFLEVVKPDDGSDKK